MEINGRRRFRTFLAGVAKLRPVAPILDTPSSAYLSAEAAGAEARRPPSKTRRTSAMANEGTAVNLGQDATVNEDNPDVTLDWAGEVVTFAEITTGGFSANSLIVKVSLLSCILLHSGCKLTVRLRFFSLFLFCVSVICICSSRLFRVSSRHLRYCGSHGITLTSRPRHVVPTATCDRSSISLTNNALAHFYRIFWCFR